MEFKRIKETCFYTTDLQQAHDFYHTTLGLEVISYVEGKHIFFRVGDSVLLCFNPDDSRQKKSPPGHYAHGEQHFAFEVPADQYEKHKSQLQAKGVAIIDEVQWQTGAKSFYFRDPTGNVLEIIPENGLWI
jgi:catechol 2,3-dioxygenase-like lactoylglutathione lyase family enzyme